MRLVISVPVTPHLIVDKIVPVLAKKHIGFKPLDVSVCKLGVPDAKMPFSHYLARPFVMRAKVKGGDPKKFSTMN